MPFKDVLNDAKKKHEEEIAIKEAKENEKKLEEQAQKEKQQLIDKEFNLLAQKVIGLLEEVEQYYPKFKNYIVATPNKRTLKVAWDTQTEITQRYHVENHDVPDSIYTYPETIEFYQNVRQELQRFFLKVDSDGNCHYCDGDTKKYYISSGRHGSTSFELEQVLLGNIIDLVSIMSVLQKIIANRIIKENFPKIELYYNVCVENSELPNNYEERLLFIKKLKQKLPKLMTEEEAVRYTLQNGMDEKSVTRTKNSSLESFLE